MNSSLSTSMQFAPLIEPIWLIIAVAIGALLLALSLLAYKKSALPRSLCLAVFILILLNPSILKENRDYKKDTLAIVVDQSVSQNMGDRKQRTDAALEYLQKQLNENDRFNTRVIHAPADNFAERTDLFGALDQAMADIPKSQRAGVVFITDGQVHDAPKDSALFNQYGPVHTLLSGSPSERDRQIIVTQSPAYGIVGEDITVSFRVTDTDNIGRKTANITITLHDGTQRYMPATIGVEHSFTFTLEHPSQNVVAIEVDPVDDEITLTNNKAAIIINGVRDRLKVLLVSGVPHSGERTWRDLLTSDPGVDLVHFTILREPRKLDYTPQDELSLIAFPFRELFEVKLYDFDLIIFDRYRVNNILPPRYFQNIANYVKEGGAFLAATGPNFATKRSIYRTALGDILPGSPLGDVEERGYTPLISELGDRHPVTKSLIWNNNIVTSQQTPEWGEWLRYINVDAERGNVLMQNENNAPLLILDRVDKGRVAQLSSDQIWLWSRGYDGGGPHSELLRRIVHWLMKEPELDEHSLNIQVNKNLISVKKPIFEQTQSEEIIMTDAEGKTDLITLKADDNGSLYFQTRVKQHGIYSFEDANAQRKFAIVGNLQAPEFQTVRTSADILSPIVNATNGAMIWLEDTPEPTIKSLSQARHYGGKNWLAFKLNNDYSVTDITNTQILPTWLSLLILLSCLIGLWVYEGRTRA